MRPIRAAQGRVSAVSQAGPAGPVCAGSPCATPDPVARSVGGGARRRSLRCCDGPASGRWRAGVTSTALVPGQAAPPSRSYDVLVAVTERSAIMTRVRISTSVLVAVGTPLWAATVPTVSSSRACTAGVGPDPNPAGATGWQLGLGATKVSPAGAGGRVQAVHVGAESSQDCEIAATPSPVLPSAFITCLPCTGQSGQSGQSGQWDNVVTDASGTGQGHHPHPGQCPEAALVDGAGHGEGAAGADAQLGPCGPESVSERVHHALPDRFSPRPVRARTHQQRRQMLLAAAEPVHGVPGRHPGRARAEPGDAVNARPAGDRRAGAPTRRPPQTLRLSHGPQEKQ